MSTDAERIVAAETRRAYGEAAREIGRQFGNVLAGVVVGAMLMAAAVWIAFMLWLAVSESLIVLTSPLFIAGAEAVAFFGLRWLWRLFHPKKGE